MIIYDIYRYRIQEEALNMTKVDAKSAWDLVMVNYQAPPGWGRNPQISKSPPCESKFHEKKAGSKRTGRCSSS